MTDEFANSAPQESFIMTRLRRLLAGSALVAASLALSIAARATSPESASPAATKPSVDEARGRAKLLQESITSTLKVIHHEYYREDEKLPIPARTFRKVFQELAEKQHVELRWLAITGAAMNVNHNPKTSFEKAAADAIGAGADEYEATDDGFYRRVGVIPLTSECLKCHAPNRTDVKTRKAGLVIAIPIK